MRILILSTLLSLFDVFSAAQNYPDDPEYDDVTVESKSQLPTVTVLELEYALDDPKLNPTPRKVLEGIENDLMDLLYELETPYTTGKTVIPTGSTIEDVEQSIDDNTVGNKFKDIFVKISETYRSGDLTPQTENRFWDPKLTPVLVFLDLV